MDAKTAVDAWKRFANGISVERNGQRKTWAEYISTSGGSDEEELVQPNIFPKFAEEFLGFVVGDNLAPEVLGNEGKPDFRPADAGTHPFVFETKPTNLQTNFNAHHPQFTRYLTEGRARIHWVVVTNMVAIKVYKLDEHGTLEEHIRAIDLRAVLQTSTHVEFSDGARLAQFIDEFSFRNLSHDEKMERIKSAEEWIPLLEVTNPEWTSRQLDRVVVTLTRDVAQQVNAGILARSPHMSYRHLAAITEELRELEFRLGGDWDDAHARELSEYTSAGPDTVQAKALAQFESHVAYFAATRLLVVRIWEDLSLLDEFLRDGGFSSWLESFNNTVDDVVSWSFKKAENRYPSLFRAQNNYTWYEPSREALIDTLFDLSNTYFGAIESDVLGDVYQRLLERVDRKNIGQFYTPRDIIRFMWDLLNPEELFAQSEETERETRVLDIATGSGGFLVEAAERLRHRGVSQVSSGASIPASEVISRLAQGLVGVEIQRFPAYLAEVNLLVQVGRLMQVAPEATVSALGILCGDTMGLHEPEHGDEASAAREAHDALIEADPFREQLLQRVKDVSESGFEFDVACGNPPYIGEKRAATILKRTREVYPYWDRFVGPHMDVLYWFLILGVSKLRVGGRFAFITTEYWLRADGAKPLRSYLAARCQIDRILIFGGLRLFPDAPGQHSLIITGERVVGRDETQPKAAESFPSVSVYSGGNLDERDRSTVLDRMRSASSGASVRSFRAKVSPNALGGAPWGEVVLSPTQLAKRRKISRNAEPLSLFMEEGVIATPDRLRNKADARKLPAETLDSLGIAEGRKPPVFVFRSDEISSLGSLSKREIQKLRPLLNTAQVYPYAAVPPSSADRLLYLPRPPREPDKSKEEVQQTSFPDGLPRLEAHLERFRPLLLAKVDKWGEKRPWWSAHRHRPETMSRDPDGASGRWADYAVTTRWGAGDQLLVGLAPRGTVPASGLHTLFASEPATAAYLTALMLSTPVQELVDSLPPGEIRQTDIEALRLPLIPAAVGEMSSAALQLADIVTELVQLHGQRFPRVPAQLRSDVSLGNPDLDSWVPTSGPSATWGCLKDMPWVEGIDSSRGQAQEVSGVGISRDIFGNILHVAGRNRGTLAIRLAVEDEGILSALAAALSGMADTGGELREVGGILVPLDPETLPIRLSADRAPMEALISSYTSKRADIDALVETIL